ncbi:universal stress protein [Psychroflexus montanilacus]|uniref:universal stress protein n=1 Tax=Psychroflexus montanilacus TaxID=2873598 RepID=UPI001CC9C825|nr:universal stress protein [Psychroflexus montanilacus]MBZ9653039.1 universal stress protein [Psychroflexus montanilacus]
MKSIKNVLVGLDLSSIDEQLIKYSSFFSELAEVEKVYFVHNIKRYEISEILEKELEDIDLEELITEELKETIDKNFTADVEWQVLISDDPYTESLISYIVNKYSIDLLVLGNKNNESGSGILGFKLLRTIRCQFLWVPSRSNIKMDKIWIGTDFSSASKKCFSFSSYLETKKSIQIEAVHVYSLPIHFSPYVNNSKIEPKMNSYIDKKLDNFLKKVDYTGKVQKFKILGREANVASKLKKEAYKNNVDLLIVADKGSNTFSNLTLGSVTEDLFNRELKIPLLVAKDYIGD